MVNEERQRRKERILNKLEDLGFNFLDKRAVKIEKTADQVLDKTERLLTSSVPTPTRETMGITELHNYLEMMMIQLRDLRKVKVRFAFRFMKWANVSLRFVTQVLQANAENVDTPELIEAADHLYEMYQSVFEIAKDRDKREKQRKMTDEEWAQAMTELSWEVQSSIGYLYDLVDIRLRGVYKHE